MGMKIRRDSGGAIHNLVTSLNLILFTLQDTARPLPRMDARAVHLLEVLKRRVGDTFDAGLRNGPRGKGTILAINQETLELNFTWSDVPPPADPVTLIIGLPRPQTARKILREATAIGVETLHFVLTRKTDRAYARSTLWSTGEWERHLVDGAEQAFCTRLPTVTHDQSLAAAISTLPAATVRVALDNYEAAAPLSRCVADLDVAIVLALGPERGWSATERTLLRESRFALAHLGSRVLRVETAVVSALAVIKAQRGLM